MTLDITNLSLKRNPGPCNEKAGREPGLAESDTCFKLEMPKVRGNCQTETCQALYSSNALVSWKVVVSLEFFKEALQDGSDDQKKKKPSVR